MLDYRAASEAFDRQLRGKGYDCDFRLGPGVERMGFKECIEYVIRQHESKKEALSYPITMVGILACHSNGQPKVITGLHLAWKNDAFVLNTMNVVSFDDKGGTECLRKFKNVSVYSIPDKTEVMDILNHTPKIDGPKPVQMHSLEHIGEALRKFGNALSEKGFNGPFYFNNGSVSAFSIGMRNYFMNSPLGYLQAAKAPVCLTTYIKEGWRTGNKTAVQMELQYRHGEIIVNRFDLIETDRKLKLRKVKYLKPAGLTGLPNLKECISLLKSTPEIGQGSEIPPTLKEIPPPTQQKGLKK